MHPAPLGLATSVRFPLYRSAPGSSGESQDGARLVSGSSLANSSLVLGPFFPPRWLPFRDSDQEGSSISGRGLYLSPSPRVMEAVGLASTRELYALKWSIFPSRCENHQLDLFNFPVGTLLEFLHKILNRVIPLHSKGFRGSLSIHRSPWHRQSNNQPRWSQRDEEAQWSRRDVHRWI